MRHIVVVALAYFLAGCSGTLHVPVSDHSQAGYKPGVTSKTHEDRVHIVRRGDTLYSIAFSAGVDVRKLATSNGISSPYLIRPGQRLTLNTAISSPKSRASLRVKSHPTSRNKSKQDSSSSLPSNKPVSSWVWPVKGKILKNYSSSGSSKGVDIAGNTGQAIRSSASGKVVYAGNGLRGYGNLLIIKHNQIFLSAYAHNQRLLVKEGDAVSGGQRIAEMGRTGTDRTMLHFEIRKNGSPVNPLRYLPRRR